MKSRNDSDKDMLPQRRESVPKRLRWAADVVVGDGVKHISTDTTTSATTIIAATKPNNQSLISPAAATGGTTVGIVNKAKPKAKAPLCDFCGRFPAAIQVRKNSTFIKGSNIGSSNGKKYQALCVLHYYTTSAIHSDGKDVCILDSSLAESQLTGSEEGSNRRHKLNVQELFAEAFVQLQQDLAQESLSISTNDTATAALSKKKKNPRKAAPENDPLSILHDLGRSTKKIRKAPPPIPSSTHNSLGGGFLRPVPVPERLRRTQQQQAQLQADQMARMNRAAAATNAAAATKKKQDTSKRRQPTRKSVWNSVIDDSTRKDASGKMTNFFGPKKKVSPRAVPNNTYHEIDLTVEGVTCSCGSKDINSAGNVTSRNQDMRKGETWGMKDRTDDVVLRYRCNQCGKAWQEAG